jgi:hypothetical protein
MCLSVGTLRQVVKRFADRARSAVLMPFGGLEVLRRYVHRIELPAGCR